jgi:hypothetical protein
MKYYLALFQKIKSLYRERTGNPEELLLICPSSRLYEEDDLKLLLPDFMIEGQRKGEALLKKQDISFQLNSIPSSDRFWDVNTDKALFDVYNQLLQAAQPVVKKASPADTAAQAVLYDGKNKPTKEKKGYDKYRKDLDTIIGEWELHLAKYPLQGSDEEKAAWSERLDGIHACKIKAVADLELLGYRTLVEDALAAVNRMTEYDRFIDRLADARALMKSMEKTGVQNLAGYHDINFIPYDFMDSPSGWTSMELGKSELETLYNEARQEKELPEDYFSIEYDEKYISGIELEFAVVGLVRSWLDLEPLKSEHYSHDGARPVSDGVNINGNFILPAYPRKLVFIRNLKINIDATVKPELVENIGQLVRFGPMLMKSQLFVNASSNQRFLKAVDNGSTLKSDNLNYLSRKVEAFVETKPADPQPAAFLMASAPAARRLASRSAASVLMETRVAPLSLRGRLVNPELFQSITIPDLPVNLTSVVLAAGDSISKAPLYKCSISVLGTNNSLFREVETDKDGRISFSLPVGTFRVELRKDGYARMAVDLNIENSTPVNRAYALVRESVSYSSYFLLGVVCERLPKIPR